MPIDPAQLGEEFKQFGKKYDRALEAVNGRYVKRHVFYPSGREIWTVVGYDGDQIVNESQPYCSCRDFYFKVLEGREVNCYHILALKIAKRVELYDEVKLNDIEYPSLLRMILESAFNRASDRI